MADGWDESERELSLPSRVDDAGRRQKMEKAGIRGGGVFPLLQK